MIYFSLFIILAGIFKGFADSLLFHFETSIFQYAEFCNPKTSWKNKYNRELLKDGIKEPRFFGSTTFLVWLTDCWHCLQMFYLNCLFIGIGILATSNIVFYNNFITFVIFTIFSAILFKISFEITYKLTHK